MDTENTIRNTLKNKFDQWLDERCDKGVNTYGHELDDCPDDKFDWRDMLIEELLDGLQYQEKEIKRLKKENNEISELYKREYKSLVSKNVMIGKYVTRIKELEGFDIGKPLPEGYLERKVYKRPQPSPFEIEFARKPAYADLDD